jgi:hypothetical protein
MPAPRSSVIVTRFTGWFAALALGAAVPGCRIGGDAPLTGLPGWQRCEVQSVVARAGVLDVSLVEDQQAIRFYFPDDAPCRALLTPGAQVEYVRIAPWGVVRQGEQVCTPSGIGSLELWREARRTPPLAAPRSPARFEIVYADPDYAFARGRFGLASEIGWRLPEEVIAVVPRSGPCAVPLERGAAELEFRADGPAPFVLIGDPGDCPIAGFIASDGS